MRPALCACNPMPRAASSACGATGGSPRARSPASRTTGASTTSGGASIPSRASTTRCCWTTAPCSRSTTTCSTTPGSNSVAERWTQPYTPRMSSAPAPLLTAEQLFALPDHGGPTELVRGELIDMSPGSPRSSMIGYIIGAALLGFVRPQRLGQITGELAGYVLTREP